MKAKWLIVAVFGISAVASPFVVDWYRDATWHR
jgi:hypothetical protein